MRADYFVCRLEISTLPAAMYQSTKMLLYCGDPETVFALTGGGKEIHLLPFLADENCTHVISVVAGSGTGAKSSFFKNTVNFTHLLEHPRQW